MNATEFPPLHACHEPGDAVQRTAPLYAPDTLTLVAALKQIGTGAAADGQPWPERHQLPGRRLALADADCALAGLRVVQELLLAAERTRQNGGPDDYVGDRVMEGLMMACVALSAQVGERLRPER